MPLCIQKKMNAWRDVSASVHFITTGRTKRRSWQWGLCKYQVIYWYSRIRGKIKVFFCSHYFSSNQRKKRGTREQQVNIGRRQVRTGVFVVVTERGKVWRRLLYVCTFLQVRCSRMVLLSPICNCGLVGVKTYASLTINLLSKINEISSTTSVMCPFATGTRATPVALTIGAWQVRESVSTPRFALTTSTCHSSSHIVNCSMSSASLILHLHTLHST